MDDFVDDIGSGDLDGDGDLDAFQAHGPGKFTWNSEEPIDYDGATDFIWIERSV